MSVVLEPEISFETLQSKALKTLKCFKVKIASPSAKRELEMYY